MNVLRSSTKAAVAITALLMIPSFAMADVSDPVDVSPATSVVHVREETPAGCTANKFGREVLDCQVHSDAMGTDILVQIRPGDSHAVYLLDGARAKEDQSIWVLPDEGNAVDVLQDFHGTLVAPVGGGGSWYADWNEQIEGQDHIFKWDTFLSKELPSYLEANFGISDTGNTVVGLSMSAQSAIALAANNAPYFSHVSAMSGVYPPGSHALEILALNQKILDVGVLPMWGIPWTNEAWWNSNPGLNLAKLRDNNISLTLSAGTGFKPDTQFDIKEAGFYLEALSRLTTDGYLDQAQKMGVQVFDQRVPFGWHEAATWHDALIRDIANL